MRDKVDQMFGRNKKKPIQKIVNSYNTFENINNCTINVGKTEPNKNKNKSKKHLTSSQNETIENSYNSYENLKNCKINNADTTTVYNNNIYEHDDTTKKAICKP